MLFAGTVYVIGAAVSAEVGFPLGFGLKGEIARILSDSAMPDEVRFALHQEGQQIWSAARLLCAGLSAASSIDTLIEFHANNSMLVAAGKIGIAAAILKKEEESPLAINFRDPSASSSLPMDNVLGDLFRLIIQGVRREQIQDAFSKVAFINFNYDRSLQQYMYRGLVEHLGIPPAEAEQVVAGMKVKHPYGSLGKIFGNGSMPYGQRSTDAPLNHIAERIRTFSEGVRSDTGREIKDIVASARRLIFLGCAHHPQNMRLLDPGEVARVEHVYGTLYAPPPTDPAGCAAPSMAEFVQPSIDSFKHSIVRWGASRVRPLRSADCQIEPLTSRQLIARYQSLWTDVAAA